MTIDRNPFEAKFPVPHFAINSESANKYVIIRNEAGASWIFRHQLDAYNARWEAWQAAMAEAVATWKPIDKAPEGQFVVCMWVNAEGGECYWIDYFEDGVWKNYFNEHEHFLIAGAAKGRSEDAPYTHFMPLEDTAIDAAMANEGE